jgi:hypothetical protein
MENDRYSDMEGGHEKANLNELEEWLDDGGRTEMIIRGVLGGNHFLKTEEGMEELTPIGRSETITLDDLGIQLDVFETRINGKTKKVVEIKTMGGDTMVPVYIFAA